MSRPGWQQPRLQQVAELVGVSKATVSNALNGTGRVSEATRIRVLEAARTLGHAPSATAHARGRGNSGILGLTMATFGPAPVDYTAIPYYAELILGATDAATQRGWLLVVLPGTMSSWSWLTVPVDGVIHSEPTMTDPVLAILRQRGIPTVTDGRPVRAQAGDAWVDNDHGEATRALLEHLRDCGSRRVGILLSRHEDAYPQLVHDAYLRWCVGRQEPVIAEFDPIPQYDVAERAAARSLLSRPDPPDAVIGLYNDSGRHVLDEANRLGRSVPDDLRVACFSEDPRYEHSDPSVTTVSIQPRLLASEAVDLLVGLVNGHRGLRRQRIVPTVLQIRRSTAGARLRGVARDRAVMRAVQLTRRHGGTDPLSLPVDGIAWSVHAESADGAVLLQHDPDLPVPGASLGKVLLLTEVAARFVSGELDPQRRLRRTAADKVQDSGLWQLLAVDSLPAADVAVLVGAVSDNLATNVLLREVGLDAVAARGRRLGLHRTTLRDRVRDLRGPDVPPTLSTVTARELVVLMRAIVGPSEALVPEAAAMVGGWLAAGCDLSMVASAFDLDPLAHRDPDRGRRLINKTGTDTGVRGDAGVLTVEATGVSVAYAAVATWDPNGPDRRDEVLAAMRQVGERLSRAAG